MTDYFRVGDHSLRARKRETNRLNQRLDLYAGLPTYGELLRTVRGIAAFIFVFKLGFRLVTMKRNRLSLGRGRTLVESRCPRVFGICPV